MSTDLLNMSLVLRVERASEVSFVSLEVPRTANWVLVVIGIDATSGEDGDMNALQEASICQVQSADGVVPDGVFFVIFTPVNIWSTGRSSSVENVCGFHSLQFCDDSLSILHADCGGVDLLS